MCIEKLNEMEKIMEWLEVGWLLILGILTGVTLLGGMIVWVTRYNHTLERRNVLTLFYVYVVITLIINIAISVSLDILWTRFIVEY